MRILTQAAWLFALASAIANASPEGSPSPSMQKAEHVYEYGNQLAPTKHNAPPSITLRTSASPILAPVSPAPAPQPDIAPLLDYQYEMILTADTADVRVVRFNEATCVSLDSCLPGANVVNATWVNDLGSPSDNVVTFYSDRDCHKPVTTELPSPGSLDFSAQSEVASPRSFSVGEWFIHFDYSSHLVEPCTVDASLRVL